MLKCENGRTAHNRHNERG